jgi:hypothetical protein
MRLLVRVILAALLLCAGGAYALPVCSAGQKPYTQIDPGTGTPAGGYGHYTPMGVCYYWAAASSAAGYDWLEYGQGYCMLQRTSDNSITYSAVTKVCEPESPHWADPGKVDGLSPVMIADYMAVWGLFLAAGVTIICAKAIYARFRIDHA